MRRLAWLLVLALLLGLTACTDDGVQGPDTQVITEEPVTGNQEPQQGEQVLTQEEQAIVDKIEADSAATMGAAPDADDHSWEVLEGENQGDTILLNASIYTLSLPADWEGHYVAEETNNWLSIFSKENADAGHGGMLCNIVWTDDEMQYIGLPSYEILGQLTMDGVTYDVVAETMTALQCPESGELYDQYVALQADLPEIFASIDFGGNGTFTPAA